MTISLINRVATTHGKSVLEDTTVCKINKLK